MVNAKEIVIRVGPDGRMVIEAEGFTGPACLEAIRKFSQALGVELEAEAKPEFYQAVDAEGDAGLTLGGGVW